MSDFAEKYPEHVKLAKIAVQSQAVGEFLDNSRFVLAEWAEKEDCWLDCKEDHPHLKEVRQTLEQVLAEHFGINERKVEEEKRAMLEELRS